MVAGVLRSGARWIFYGCVAQQGTMRRNPSLVPPRVFNRNLEQLKG